MRAAIAILIFVVACGAKGTGKKDPHEEPIPEGNYVGGYCSDGNPYAQCQASVEECQQAIMDSWICEEEDEADCEGGPLPSCSFFPVTYCNRPDACYPTKDACDHMGDGCYAY